MSILEWFRRTFNTVPRRCRVMRFKYEVREFPAHLLRSVQSVNDSDITIDGKVYEAGTLMFQAINGTWDGKEFYLTTVEIAYCGMSWQLWPRKVIGKWYRYVDSGVKMYNEIDFIVLFAYLDKANNEREV